MDHERDGRPWLGWVTGLFELRSGKPVPARFDPGRGIARIDGVPLSRVLIYDFGAESHRRLLVCGPGNQIREFGIDPFHREFWAAYARHVGPQCVADPGRPAWWIGDTFPMPWLDPEPSREAEARANLPETAAEKEAPGTAA